MKVHTVKKLLKASYDTKKPSVENYQRDKSLSGKRVSVFYNKDTGKAVVAHRGSASATDWLKTNSAMAVGYEGGSRFRHAKKIQKRAEKKYGSANTVTLGHSLGGRIAEKVGKNSSQTITVNKAVTPKSLLQPTRATQVDIRSGGDLVSMLGKFQKRDGKLITLRHRNNLLNAHKLGVLKDIKDKSV